MLDKNYMGILSLLKYGFLTVDEDFKALTNNSIIHEVFKTSLKTKITSRS